MQAAGISRASEGNENLKKKEPQPARTVHSHAACGFTKSIWQPRWGGCCQSISLHIPSQKTPKENKHKTKRHCVVTRFVSASQTAAALQPVNEPWEGKDGRPSSITAAAVHVPPAASCRHTMWESMCPRMQMPLTGRDGLCNGDRLSGDATDDTRSANCLPGCSSHKDVGPANVMWTSQ